MTSLKLVIMNSNSNGAITKKFPIVKITFFPQIQKYHRHLLAVVYLDYAVSLKLLTIYFSSLCFLMRKQEISVLDLVYV